MGRSQKRGTLSQVDNMLQKGRGSGHGASYIPWLTVRDVPSIGLSSRIKGWKTDRIHHFFSKLELSYFYILEWSPFVLDIREQYPLPIESTMEIAERLGIKHPVEPRSQEPIVMTTDFLIDVEVEERMEMRARTIKPKSKLSSKRIIEKFEIERTYWKEQGIDWGIVTEDEIPEPMASNVAWLHPARKLAILPISKPSLELIEPIFLEYLQSSTYSLSESALNMDEKLGLEPGSCLTIFRHLVATQEWSIDMNVPIETNKSIKVKRKFELQRRVTADGRSI